MEYFKSLSFWQIYFYSENCCVIQEGKKKTQNHRTWRSGDVLWLLWLICIKSILLTVFNLNLKNLLHGSKCGAVLH